MRLIVVDDRARSVGILSASVSRENAKNWARPFTARLLEPGLVSYEDRGCGIALLRKETIDRDIHSFVGRPLIIKHAKTSPANMKEVGHGYVHEVFYNPTDGWWYGRGLADTDESVAAIERHGKDSVGYKVTRTGPGSKWHDMAFDEEILGFTGEHLAIVGNPRYEEATIRLNSKNQTNNAMSMFKLFSKKVASPKAGGDDAAQAAAAKAAKDKADADAAAARENSTTDIGAESELEIPTGVEGKTEKVTLATLIEVYNSKKNGEDMDGDSEVVCNGKSYKLNALIQAFDKWTTHNALEEEKKAKENAKGATKTPEELAAADAEAKRVENAKIPAKGTHFRVLENAALRAPAPVARGPLNSLEERLARGSQMFGTAKKS